MSRLRRERKAEAEDDEKDRQREREEEEKAKAEQEAKAAALASVVPLTINLKKTQIVGDQFSFLLQCLPISRDPHPPRAPT